MEPYDAQQMITGEIFLLIISLLLASVFLFPSAPDGVGTTKTGSPGALRTPRRVAMATVLRVDNGCSFLLLLPLSCLCFLVLFSRKEVPPPQRTPSHLLSDAAPCLAVQGPVRPFITTSQHLGSCAVHHPITWPADLPLHCAIVLSLRGSTQWPRRERQHVLSLCNTAGFSTSISGPGCSLASSETSAQAEMMQPV